MKDFRVQDLLKKDVMINLIKNIRKTRVYVVNLLSRGQVSTWFWKTWGFSERLLFPERQFDVFFQTSKDFTLILERLHFDFRKTSFWFERLLFDVRKTSFCLKDFFLILERLFLCRKTSFSFMKDFIFNFRKTSERLFLMLKDIFWMLKDFIFISERLYFDVERLFFIGVFCTDLCRITSERLHFFPFQKELGCFWQFFFSDCHLSKDWINFRKTSFLFRKHEKQSIYNIVLTLGERQIYLTKNGGGIFFCKKRVLMKKIEISKNFSKMRLGKSFLFCRFISWKT